MSKSRYKYEADITCICGILYLKLNSIDAINSHQKLNYAVIRESGINVVVFGFFGYHWAYCFES